MYASTQDLDLLAATGITRFRTRTLPVLSWCFQMGTS